MNCKNCNSEVNSKFCADCGQPKSFERIDGNYLIHEIAHTLDFERGFLFTVRKLITDPGQSVKDYLTVNRNRFVKPIIFIIITSLIYSQCNSFFHFEDGNVTKYDIKSSATTTISKWVQEHYGYANIIMAIFIALWTNIFFRKYKFNIFEILILLCFVMGMGMLVLSIFGIIQSMVGKNLSLISNFVCFLYVTWAIGQFYDKGKFTNYIKVIFAYILGMITFFLTSGIIGTIIDLITNK